MTVYGTGGQLAGLRGVLSDRDIAILTDVQRVRLLHARQIQRLHFLGRSEISDARRCRRILKRLHERKTLKRLDRRIGGVYAGSAGFIYSLDTLGQRLLNSSGPAGGQRRRRPWEPSAAFQDHILQVSELYVRLKELERTEPDIELLKFQAEPGCWRHYTGLGGARLTLKPDAYLSVAAGPYVQLSFVEVDRATEHVPTLRRKLAGYQDAFEAGVEQQGGEAFPNVVWIVPSYGRALVLERQIARLPPDHAELFAVAIEGKELSAIINNEQEQLRGGE